MEKEHWQDWLSGLVGLWLVASPWVLAAQEPVAIYNSMIVGLIVAVLAASELAVFQPWKEWAIAALGAWLFLAPRIMSFATDSLMWNSAACGVVVIALAGWAIGDAHEILPRLGRPKGDLRGDMPGLSLPDEHEHMAEGYLHRHEGGPGIVHPGSDTQSPGQVSHQ